MRERRAAARSSVAPSGDLIGVEPGAGLDDLAEQQLRCGLAQQGERRRKTEPRPAECGEDAVGEDDIGEPDHVGERSFKERAGQQVQPDGGKRGAALGQIPRRVGNGGVSTARGDLAHIVYAPQRSRVQRGRRPASGPRTRALFQGDKFSGAVQVGARLDVVDAEERVGQRAPLRNTWFGVAWCRTNLICHVYLPLVSAAPREGRSRVSSWYGTGMRVQVIRDRRFWIPPRNSSSPSPQIS